MFPCFDQPNLKAPIRLITACPEGWKVISTMNKKNEVVNKFEITAREKEINSTLLNIPKIREDFTIHEFETTPAIAMYTFAVCAGNFAEIEDFSYDKDDKLPQIRLYCRGFIEKAVDPFNIFKTAKETLKWFRENLTSFQPFEKFDLVFVPNFKQIAMENVGCITFDDKFLEPVQTPVETAYFHSLIAHEFAHTWFGNHVTPEWWDDLWLNESFSTFLSYLCLKQISENVEKHMEDFHIMWLLFSRAKSNAVVYDQYKSTHKIRDTVTDTAHAEIVFDDITYFKGASILKYYYYVTGHELFFKGLKNYINKYGGRTANYEQFKEILKNLSEVREIKPPLDIIEPFLDNVGINRLDSNMKCSLTSIEEFTVTQHPCSFATPNKFYPYTMNILLIYENKEVILYNVEVSDSPISLIKALEKVDKPCAVVLNAGDWAYFKQNFDDMSRDYLIEHTYKVKDSTTRLVIARDFCEMIKEGAFDPESYIQFVVNLLKHEKEAFVVVQVLKTAIYIISHFVLFDNQNTLKETLFDLIREEVFFKFKNIRKTLINFLIDLIDFSNDKQIRYIIYFLKGERDQPSLLRGDSETLENINLIHNLDLSYVDESTKFRLLETIAESDVLSKEDKKQFEDIITAIEVVSSRSISRTSSAIDIRAGTQSKPSILTGRRLEQITLEACKPIRSLKEKLWNMFVNKDLEMLNEEYEAYMKGFARKSQMKLLREYFTKRFFEDFEYVKNYWGEDYAVIFFENLNPSFMVNDQVLKSFIELSKTIRINEYKLKSLFERSKFYGIINS